MNSEFRWHVAVDHNRFVWLAAFHAETPNESPLLIAAWPDPKGSEWEWEILDCSSDTHVCGGLGGNQESAMVAAELAARSLGGSTSEGVRRIATGPRQASPTRLAY